MRKIPPAAMASKAPPAKPSARSSTFLTELALQAATGDHAATAKLLREIGPKVAQAVREGGADDYIAKPFSSRELLARIRAHARRARGASGPAKKELRVGRLTVDVESMSAMLDGKSLALTTYEFMLLRALAERAGRVLSREQLVDIVRGSAEEAFDRSVDVHISHLRAKLGDDSRHPRLIKTVRGVGYMFAVEPS